MVSTCRDDSRYWITITPIVGANFQDYFVNVQSVVIDAMDRLWVLDAGRPSTPSGSGVLSSHGGVKLIGINLSNQHSLYNHNLPHHRRLPRLSKPSLPSIIPVYLPTLYLYRSLKIEFQRRPFSISAPASRLQAKASHTSPTPAPKAATGSSSSTSVPESPGAI